nr:Chain C, LRN peptide [Homo sapiens]6PYV_C Chain C, LRN peptide [Homo sapiens]6PYW_C Chain C, LRN peptide [Homo sapiens]6PZ5_C Chain C, LRN peptide [Homo sapiens]
LRNQSVFNF